jgi:hypothetical protein
METSVYVPPERWYLSTSPHGVTTQKTNIDISTAVRIPNPMQLNIRQGKPLTKRLLEMSIRFSKFPESGMCYFF